MRAIPRLSLLSVLLTLTGYALPAFAQSRCSARESIRTVAPLLKASRRRSARMRALQLCSGMIGLSWPSGVSVSSAANALR